MNPKLKLAEALSRPGIMSAPGVYDALSAHLAQQAGFEAVFLSGSAMSYTMLGQPDVGLLTISEIVDVCARVSDRISIPILVDVDSGFGNAAHAARTLRSLEKAGASAVQIEDQLPIKPANKLSARPLVSTDVMVDKIKTLLDERCDETFLISARSDSPATEPMSHTLDRVHAYRDAGADLIFVEGLKSQEDVSEVVKAASGKPVVYNLLHRGGAISSAAELEALGVSIALFPGHAVLSATAAMQQTLTDLRSTLSLEGKELALDPKGLNGILGASDFIGRFSDYSE